MNEILGVLMEEKCVELLTQNGIVFFIQEQNCLRNVIARLLGVAIILGSVLLKLPQIVAIEKSKSVDGLDPMSFYIDIVIYLSTVVYNYVKENPPLSYFESVFILIQNCILVVLLWKYSKSENRPTAANRNLIILSFAVMSALFLLIPTEYQYILQVCNLPLLAWSRVSQIITNFRNRSTGQLSIITFLLTWLGTVARLFTTIVTVGWDYPILAGLATSFSLTSIIILQMLLWGSGKKKSD